MNRFDLDDAILALLNEKAEALENRLKAAIVAYIGMIHPALFRQFRDTIEAVRYNTRYPEHVCVLLGSDGGSVETAERMAAVLRHHFVEVSFLVPDSAMSAGTILCMSGDRIYMDYSSSLGPIDPQVLTPDGSGYIAAMGYLDKVMEIIQKGELTPADIVLLRGIDLGKLALFEQARNLSVDLLKRWLLEFKFRNWTHHRTNSIGATVTLEEKIQRAEEIAMALSDHKLWRSHGRALDLHKLRKLRLEVDDFSEDVDLFETVRSYNDPLSTYAERIGQPLFMHNHSLFRR